MTETIRQEGYLVFQESQGPTGWHEMFPNKEEAEAKAVEMLSLIIPVFVIPAVRFTTRKIEAGR